MEGTWEKEYLLVGRGLDILPLRASVKLKIMAILLKG